jgi:hypothetical protein
MSVCRSFSSEWSRSSVSTTFRAVPRDDARGRECPPVPKCTRLVPAKSPNFVITGNTNCPFAGLFFKPSDGLEPSTPSSPWRFPGVTRVHARSLATQFLLQIGMVLPPKMRRETSRVSFLMCPFCVRPRFSNQATRVAIRWRHRPATEGARRNRCRCSWGGTLGARLLRTISGSIRCSSYSLCFKVR